MEIFKMIQAISAIGQPGGTWIMKLWWTENLTWTQFSLLLNRRRFYKILHNIPHDHGERCLTVRLTPLAGFLINWPRIQSHWLSTFVVSNLSFTLRGFAIDSLCIVPFFFSYLLTVSSLEQLSGGNVFSNPRNLTWHHVITLSMTDIQTSDLKHIGLQHHLIYFMFICYLL